MTVMEFLKTSPIDQKYIADRMWPKNKNAKVYLSMKLSGIRPFTQKDADLAMKVLKELGVKISELEA
jgi:hypothetical protein